MNTRTLRAHLKARGWSQNELASRIGVSRQAVSLWLKRPEISVRSNHLLSVSKALGIPVESLVQPLPALGDEGDHELLRATYLWDRLYPDLDDFAIAVNRWEPSAVGRLVQVSGLFVAERLLGRAVWKKFDLYKHHIHSARRQQLEGLVKWHEHPTRD
ncbi:MAG: helix-turn-helix domain-containing protein [bacterium]